MWSTTGRCFAGRADPPRSMEAEVIAVRKPSLLQIAARTLLDLAAAVLLAALVWIVFIGGDLREIPQLPMELRRPRYLLLLLAGVTGMRLLLFGGLAPLYGVERVRRWAFTALLFFLLAVAAVKSFVSLVDVHHFHRSLERQDWLHTFSADLAIGLGAALLLLAGTVLVQWVKGVRPLLAVANLLLLFLAVALLALGILHVLLGYTYFEWGSFLEPQHFEAMRMAGVGEEAVDLFFRPRTLVALGAIAGLLWLAARLEGILHGRFPRGLVPVSLAALLLVPALPTAREPLRHPDRFAPSVQSPLLLLLRPVSGNMNGVRQEALRGVEPLPPARPATVEVRPEYRALEGAARGRSVLFFIMESVRRRSVPLYGYRRDNMPFFTSLADHAIVFQQGYVMQPRSSKAMTALALGVMPDPRLQPLSWEESRVFGRDTLFNRLVDGGRRYYLGTAHHRGADNIDRFFDAAANGRADRVVTREMLNGDPEAPNEDVALARDFVRWVAGDDRPFVALLWTHCAHMPYNTKRAPFGRRQLRDRYDNCLRQIDNALREVVEGLRRAGRLEETLLVALGDHGEALGEKFDRGHGNYLYEHSLRIPVLIYNPALFPRRIDVDARFQLKDIPSTLLYLLGEPSRINQSVNIFAKGALDKLYLSNVYQDFKLGVILQRRKFVYRPTFDIAYVYDLAADPGENVNIAGRYDEATLEEMKREVLGWYLYQTRYIEERYPAQSGPVRREAATSSRKHAGG